MPATTLVPDQSTPPTSTFDPETWLNPEPADDAILIRVLGPRVTMTFGDSPRIIQPALYPAGKEEIPGPFFRIQVRFREVLLTPPHDAVKHQERRFEWMYAESLLSGGSVLRPDYDWSKAERVSIPGHGGSDELWEDGYGMWDPRPKLHGYTLFLKRDGSSPARLRVFRWYEQELPNAFFVLWLDGTTLYAGYKD